MKQFKILMGEEEKVFYHSKELHEISYLCKYLSQNGGMSTFSPSTSEVIIIIAN